jgi:dihydroflavonol-4-reductase
MTGRCKTEYIVTGATGFLGGAVVRELISRGRSVTALALPGDPLLPLLPEGAIVRFGDVTDRATLIPVFEGAEGCRVIHCAGMVSVAAGQGEALGRINVQGTENIAGLCLEYGAKRLVYVSSVHAIPERPM